LLLTLPLDTQELQQLVSYMLHGSLQQHLQAEKAAAEQRRAAAAAAHHGEADSDRGPLWNSGIDDTMM
jgi:hypothetical protein